MTTPPDTHEHEHTPGVSLAGEVVVIRHPDGMVSVTIDGVDFPYFMSKTPGMEFLEPTAERPFPVVLMPVLCASVEVREALPDTGAEQCCEDGTCTDCYEAGLADALEGLVVHHPEDEPAQ